ncbi:hypothetical protein [Occallatibacter riparius]|uniref:DUF2846 domain-containing protein n=1 Tax=Occallatibacter riparius TaxID=1002689 RepID=A0A9J7BRD2_9BACT|nr:hypothetical protein [Occallatibacter riparius]UWZ83629.1 hypothetical protein MOP44_24060 [Occallatibacter riparius]
MTRSFFAKSMFAIAIAGAAISPSMQAQNDAVTVTVPFQFAMGTQSIAPGTYQFSLTSSQYVLSVVNLKTGHAEIFNVRPERRSETEKRGNLIFRNSSGGRVLSEVHFPGTDTFSEVIERRQSARTETARSATSNSGSVGRR